MRNFLQSNANTQCCEQAEIKSAGLSLTIPGVHLDITWRPFQSGIVRAFARRQRREALRTRLFERALNGGQSPNE